jgi:hypothetical protein
MLLSRSASITPVAVSVVVPVTDVVIISVPDREVYPNASLVLVAAEVRHPATDPLTTAEQAAVKRALAARLPLSRPAVRANVSAMAAGVTSEGLMGLRHGRLAESKAPHQPK